MDVLSCSNGGFIGGGFTPPTPSPLFAVLPLCLDDHGHRFALSQHHEDRACCERCGLIREGKR